MAYYMADVEKLNLDQRDECRLSPNREVSIGKLEKIGVVLKKINFDDPDAEELMKNLVQEFHMNHHDEIHISRASLPEFEKKLKIFFSEHLHDDAEIRIIKNGTGYFDVRGENNEWIRIPTNRGDVVFLPAGLYHRFTPDRKEDIVAVRMFRTNPKWEAFNKSEGADDRPIRKEYLKSIRV